MFKSLLMAASLLPFGFAMTAESAAKCTCDKPCSCCGCCSGGKCDCGEACKCACCGEHACSCK